MILSFRTDRPGKQSTVMILSFGRTGLGKQSTVMILSFRTDRSGQTEYHHDSKFSDGQVWANRVP